MMNRRTLLTAGAGIVPLAHLAGSAVAAARFGIKPNLPRDQSAKLQKAINAVSKTGGELHLPAGVYVARKLEIRASMTLSGVAGQTRLVLARPANFLLSISRAANVTLRGIVFDGAKQRLPDDENAALVMATTVTNMVMEHCLVQNSSANGVALESCRGRVTHCSITKCTTGGIFSLDAKGLELGHNHISKIGDNGIMVWQSAKREDGTIVHHNRIEKIYGKSGGNGQYGNGVGVFRAANVIVTANRITDCNFSAIRDNAGDNVQITDNSCSRLNEVAIFVEFGFQGAVVSGNMIDNAGMGISITNFNEGGRLAVCANNVVRDMLGARSNPDTQAIGIAVEADAAVTGNVVENAKHGGIWLGWGKYLRDVTATGNVVRGCNLGIAFSVVKGAGSALIANNLISGAVQAIAGMDHDKIITRDLANPKDKAPRGILVNANLVS
jgi:uncharacterized secreted repeat protein (TIGR03808 family)